MRIAYVCLDPGVPVFGRKGSSIHCQEVIRTFLQLGFEVELFARRLGGDVPSDLVNVKVHKIGEKLDSEVEVRERQLADTNHDLMQALSDAGPFDLVYERFSLWNCAAMQFASKKDIPGILEANSPLIHEQKTYRKLIDESLAKSIRRTCFQNATSIIAVSEEVASRLRENYFAADKTTVVANGVNCQKFESIQPKEKDANAPITIGFLGTLKPWHGVSTLIDAFAIVRESRDDVRLKIVGDGPEREKLEERLHRFSLAIAESVEWTGAIANCEVPQTLRDFDIAVAPYPDLQDFYFSPLKILEYMAAGLPIVASNIGQIPTLIQDIQTGFLVKSGCERDLAEKILQLCDDSGQRTQLGDAARHKAVENHTWQHVVSRIMASIDRQPDSVEVHYGTP